MSRDLSGRIVRALLVALFVMTPGAAGNSTASAAGLGIGGPSAVYQTGTHTFTANLHAFYASYSWHVRSCPTESLTACTATWAYVFGEYIESGQNSTYSRNLVKDCTGGRTKTFQIKVTASGFNSPLETAHKVVKLCGIIP